MPLLGEVDSMPNPVQKRIKWKGSEKDGFFAYYDKEKEKEVKYELKDFIIVSIGYKVGGYNKEEETFIYSNEVDSLFKDKFVVKYASGGGEVGAGLYKEIKEKVKSAGGRLNIAVTVYTESKELVQFMLKGEAFYNFTQLLKHMDRNKNKVKFTGNKLIKVKVGSYNLPQFERGEDFEGTPEGADAADLASQVGEYRAFLKNKYANEIQSVEEEQDEVDRLLAEMDEVGETSISDSSDDDDLPF